MGIENCFSIKDMSPSDAIKSLSKLSKGISTPLELGIWNGKLHSEETKNDFEGHHIAVFQSNTLVAPFGPLFDKKSECYATLFATAVLYAQAIEQYVETLESKIPELSLAYESVFTST